MRASLLTINDICHLLKIGRTTVLMYRKRGLIPEPHFVLCGRPRWEGERFFQGIGRFNVETRPCASACC